MGNRYQQPCSIDWSAEEKQQDRTILRPLAVFFGIAISLSVLTHGCIDSADKTAAISQRAAAADSPALTSEQEEYRRFFAQHGSPAPVEMAKAVMAAKPHNRPVLAAVAIVESNANPKAVGDGGSSHGAFQVQPRHWSKVSSSPVQQALQAEQILEELVASNARGANRWRTALVRYNSGGTTNPVSHRYAARVIALAKEVKP